MARVELDIFSGRPNPSWDIGPAEESELRNMMGRLVPSPSAVNFPGLGYRGILVAFAKEGTFRFFKGKMIAGSDSESATHFSSAREIEKWLVERGRAALDEALYSTVLGQLD